MNWRHVAVFCSPLVMTGLVVVDNTAGLHGWLEPAAAVVVAVQVYAFVTLLLRRRRRP